MLEKRNGHTWSRHLLLNLFCVFIGASCLSVSANEMGATSQPLVSIEGQRGWNTGVRLQWERRQWLIDELTQNVEARRLTGRLGVRVLPFLHVWGEAGVVEVERWDTNEKKTGFAWGVGGGASVFEYVINRSPVVGVKESVGIDVEALYRVSDVNFGEERELKWKDARIQPMFVYRLNLRGEHTWRQYEPNGYVLRGGPVYARVTGEDAEESLRERNEFGALLGIDVRWLSGWMTRFEVTWFDGSDREWSLAVHRFF